MSLYDDIIDEPRCSLGSKTTSIKLLQDHLQTKRSASKAPFIKTPGHRSISKKIDELAPPPVIGNTKIDHQRGASLLGGDWDVNEEYDPRWPNDFEKLNKERTEKQLLEKAVSKSNQVVATRSLGLDYDDDDDEYDNAPATVSSKSQKAAFGPPPSLLENVEKASGNVGNSQPASQGFAVSSVAAKIMAKMGYKEGQGLGREEQGINKALEVEKTSKHQGKIILGTTPKAPKELSITEMLKNPSRVVLLRNMVGPGEVDSELEPETKEECSKYGAVICCVIREVQDYETEEDAVRIFIEFAQVESAIKALIDLNGRYFGGRIVKASFFDQNRFHQRDL